MSVYASVRADGDALAGEASEWAPRRGGASALDGDYTPAGDVSEWVLRHGHVSVSAPVDGDASEWPPTKLQKWRLKATLRTSPQIKLS